MAANMNQTISSSTTYYPVHPTYRSIDNSECQSPQSSPTSRRLMALQSIRLNMQHYHHSLILPSLLSMLKYKKVCHAQKCGKHSAYLITTSPSQSYYDCYPVISQLKRICRMSMHLDVFIMKCVIIIALVHSY